MGLSIKAIVFLAVFCTTAVFGWEGDIVFEDNFDGGSLDMGKWEYQEGCGNEYGSGNLQCYTRNNIRVQDGLLTISARQEQMEDKQYTSGRIRQIGSGFTYGAFVVRAKLARGDHLWPAIWTLPLDNNCRYEEIDIAEYRGQPGESSNYEMAGHWGRSWDALTSKGIKMSTGVDLSTEFHEFAILWLPSRLEWYFDNNKMYEVSLEDGTFNGDPDKFPCLGGNQPFDYPTNIILNLAVGGPFFADFPVFDPSTWSKPSMEVDWVRIYQGA